MSNASELARFFTENGPLLLLTGAGISTKSGIPDYRDEAGEWKHSRPIQYKDFISGGAARKRYWARSMLGWPRMRFARPNDAHLAITALQTAGAISNVITQNVDGLHQRAGTVDVTDLHGNLDDVICLGCGRRAARAEFQQRLRELNPVFAGSAQVLASAPDGDAEIETANIDEFKVPECIECRGIVKPDVVFFGEAVPADRVAACYAASDRSTATLVAGSSLVVFSGFRFARHAHQAGKPVALLNRGHNRAAALASLKIDADCGSTLVACCTHLGIQVAGNVSRQQAHEY